MATFVHISNISAVTDQILTKLQSQLSGTIFNYYLFALDNLRQLIWTFVHATFVLSTFVHISNISAVTDLILTKLQSQLSGTIFNRCHLSQWHLSRQHLSWRHLSISGIYQLLMTKFWRNFLSKFFFVTKIFEDQNFFEPWFFLTQHFIV